MKTLLITILFALSVSLGFRGCGDDGVWRGSYNTKNHAATPKGANVFSANKINRNLFPDIDRGFDQAFRIARQYGYQTNLSHGSYRVALFLRSPKCINPGFLVAADGQPLWPNGWDNHPDFDKDPRVGKVLLCAAGLTPSIDVMVIADNPSHIFNIVWFEAEHLILGHNDVNKWAETSGVHSHPILPDQESSLTEKESLWTPFGVKITKDIKADNITVKEGTQICVLLVK